MSARNVLVIGANRGLGLGLLKVFKAHGWTVFGTVRPQTRSDSSFKDLEATGATIIDLDYLDEGSIAAAAEIYGQDRALDVLVNCAGLPVDPESWLDNTGDSLTQKLRVMTVGPFLSSKYFLPSLQKSQLAKIVNITSLWASVEWNDMGKFIGYRTAKSALNSMAVTIALELKAAKENIAVLCMDPGYVPTRLSKWEGDVKLEDSVNGMFKQIDQATMADTGSFLSWKGEKRPF